MCAFVCVCKRLDMATDRVMAFTQYHAQRSCVSKGRCLRTLGHAHLHLRTGPNPQRGLDPIPNSVPRTETLSSLLSTRDRALYPNLPGTGPVSPLLGKRRRKQGRRRRPSLSVLSCLSSSASVRAKPKCVPFWLTRSWGQITVGTKPKPAIADVQLD